MELSLEWVWEGITDLVYVFSWSLIWPVQYVEWIQFEDQILHPKHYNHQNIKIRHASNFQNFKSYCQRRLKKNKVEKTFYFWFISYQAIQQKKLN